MGIFISIALHCNLEFMLTCLAFLLYFKILQSKGLYVPMLHTILGISRAYWRHTVPLPDRLAEL